MSSCNRSCAHIQESHRTVDNISSPRFGRRLRKWMVPSCPAHLDGFSGVWKRIVNLSDLSFSLLLRNLLPFRPRRLHCFRHLLLELGIFWWCDRFGDPHAVGLPFW